MATLKLNECQAARDCAKKYPPGCGYRFLWIPLPPAEAYELGIYDDNNVEGSNAAAIWLRHHPKDVDKGCPAVAVAAVRGDLSKKGITDALIDISVALGMTKYKYSDLLNDPETIVEKLDALEVELREAGEKKDGNTHSQ
jgi:hypothetical protein